jgi:hypothetical protein
MIRAIPYLIGFAVCLLTYGVLASISRLLREVRKKLAGDREADRLRGEMQGVRIHEEEMRHAG